MVREPGLAGDGKLGDRERAAGVVAHGAAPIDVAARRLDAHGEPALVERQAVPREVARVVLGLREEHEVRREREAARLEEEQVLVRAPARDARVQHLDARAAGRRRERALEDGGKGLRVLTPKPKAKESPSTSTR